MFIITKLAWGVDRFKHPSHGLIEELLAIVCVALDKILYSLGVVQRHAGNLSHNGIDAVLRGKISHLVNYLCTCHSVAES